MPSKATLGYAPHRALEKLQAFRVDFWPSLN